MSRWWKPSRDTLERLSGASLIAGISLGSAALVVGPSLLAAQERQALIKKMAMQPLPVTHLNAQAETLPLRSLIAGGQLQQPILEISLPAPTAHVTTPHANVASGPTITVAHPTPRAASSRASQAARLEKPNTASTAQPSSAQLSSARPSPVRLAPSRSTSAAKPTSTRSFARQTVRPGAAATTSIVRANPRSRALQVKPKRSTTMTTRAQRVIAQPVAIQAVAARPAPTVSRARPAPVTQKTIRIARASSVTTSGRRESLAPPTTTSARAVEPASIPNRLGDTRQQNTVSGKTNTSAFPSLTNEPEAPNRPFLERDREP